MKRKGNYLIYSTVNIKGGSNWAFQLDGLITIGYDAYVSGKIAGTAFEFKRANEFELNSSNGNGAIWVIWAALVFQPLMVNISVANFSQGQGYIYRMRPGRFGRSGWPRLVRFALCSNFTAHDIMLVDSASFHLVVTDASNAEIHRITMRGGNQGALDGLDISGTNYYVHHLEVTNR
ncbi:hypothetical protein FRC06_006166, partial [Ceratobasidium sp. 370]